MGLLPGLHHHSVMAGATGHVGETQGGELCDKRSRRHFTLADALQPCVHGTRVHTHTQREPLHSSGHKCVERTFWNGMPQASVATQESPCLREVLMLRSPKADRHNSKG